MLVYLYQMHVVITTVCQVKWCVTVTILMSTISEKSNRNQKCKSTDCQSKNKYNWPDKETMMTCVPTPNGWLHFPISSFHVYLQRYVHLKSLSDLFLHSKTEYPVILPAMHQSPRKQYGSMYHVTWFFRDRSCRNSIYKWTLVCCA